MIEKWVADMQGYVKVKHSKRTRGDKRFQILGLNVGGLISKLNLCIIQKYINDFDVICISETKLDQLDETNISLEGFTHFYQHRRHFLREPGGLVTLVKREISSCAKGLKVNNHEYGQWTYLEKEVLGYDLIKGTLYRYIPLADSPYNTRLEFDNITRPFGHQY